MSHIYGMACGIISDSAQGDALNNAVPEETRTKLRFLKSYLQLWQSLLQGQRECKPFCPDPQFLSYSCLLYNPAGFLSHCQFHVKESLPLHQGRNP